MHDIPKSERLEALSDEFAERIRRRDRPSVDEYIRRYPDLADEIQDAFPVILMMEELAPTEHGPSSNAVVASENKSKLQLSNYKLIRELGRGGMGVVYEAEQKQLSRRVALKVLPSRMARQQVAVERFQREAQAAARLDHANIVPIHEVGSEDGTLFYTMQLIRGHGLDVLAKELRQIRDHGHKLNNETEVSGIAASICQDRSLDPDETSAKVNPHADSPTNTVPKVSTKRSSATSQSGVPGTFEYARSVARIGIQVADALRFAHERGVVHRDIKPSNLMIDPLVHVWVTDFGLAKLEESDLTNEGDVLGTLRYMAPEQLRGWADPRSDVYSLGITLYELLVLRPAFETSNRAELLQSIVEEQPPYLRSLDSSIPRDLETIISKAIAKEPADRYQDSATLRDDLRSFVEFRPISARPSTPWDSLRRWTFRNKALATAGVMLLVMLMGWGITASYAAVQARQREREISDTLEQLYSATMQGIREEAFAGNYASILSDIERLEDRVEANWELQYVKRLLNEPHVRLIVGEHPLINSAMSPDGKWFAAADYFRGVRVWDAETHEQLRHFEISTENLNTGRLRASRDGRTLVCSTNSTQSGRTTFHFMDVTDESHRKPEARSVEGRAFDITLSGSKGEYLVYQAGKHGGLFRVKIADMFEGKALDPARITHPEMLNCDLVDGQLHGTIEGGATSQDYRVIWDIESKREVLRTPITKRYQRVVLIDGGSKYAFFSPDERQPRMAPYRSASVEIRDSASHETVSRFDFEEPLRSCQISSDGRFVAGYMDGDDRFGDLALYDIATQQKSTLRGHEGTIASIQFAANSQHIVSLSHDQTVRVWPLSVQPEYFEGPEQSNPKLSPDGSVLATNVGNEICLWDAMTLKLLRTLRGHVPQLTSSQYPYRQRRVFPMDFSPDGTRLVTGSERGEVIVWDTQSETPIYYTRQVWGPCHKVRFHPNGRAVVGIFANGDCSSLDLESKKWRQINHDEGRSLWALALSPDGNWVVPAGTVATPRMIPYSALSELKTKKFENESLSLHHAVFSSDGSRMIVGGKNRYASLFDTSSRKRVAKLGQKTDVTGIAMLSDDTRCMTTGRGDKLHIFDSSDGNKLLTLQSDKGNLAGVAIAPGSKSAAVYTGGDRIRIWEPKRVSADTYEKRRLYRQAQLRAKEARFDDRPLLVDEATDRIVSNTNISAEVREAAIRHLNIRGEDVGTLFGLAWQVATKDAAAATITPAIAVTYVEACQKAVKTEFAEVVSLLGMVKYLNGDYEESLRLLRLARDRYEKIEMAPDFQFSYRNNQCQLEERSLNKLYLAMAEHQLKTGNAKETLRPALEQIEALEFSSRALEAVGKEASAVITD